MKLFQLEYFCAVCQTGSVTHAAYRLHVSQPSVSGAIKELEKEYGVNLFSRQGGHLALTEEGQLFYERASEILEKSRQLEQVMWDYGQKNTRIKIGVPPMIGTCLFPRMYEEFHALCPQITMEIREWATPPTKSMVEKDRLDLAIVILDSQSEEQFGVLPLFDTRLFFCVAREHPMAVCPRIRLEQLEGQPVILMQEDSFQHSYLQGEFARLGVQPNVLLCSNQLYTIRRFLEGGRAGAFLFQQVAQEDPGLVGIPIEGSERLRVGLIWKKNRKLFGAPRRFVQFLQQYECFKDPS